MFFISRLKTTPLWLMAPAIGVAAITALAAAAYEPLVFDPSLYEMPTALATELKTIDAEALEAQRAADAEPPVLTTAAISPSMLADGIWTGYAPCGTGNPDNWKPYYVAVTIAVENGRVSTITDIRGTSNGPDGTLNWDAAENQTYLTWAESGHNGQAGVRGQIATQLARTQAVSGIDTVSGATYSSVAIYNAYADAVARSATAAGASSGLPPSTEPTPDTPAPMHLDGHAIGKLADGSWTGYAACGIGNDEDWEPYYVAVTVIVEEGRPIRVEDAFGTSSADAGDELNWDAAENQTYLDWASNGRTRSSTFYTGVLTQISAALDAGEMPTGIDTVSGATYSSTSLFNAYYAALRKSAEAAGSALDTPPLDPPSADPDPNPEPSDPDPNDPVKPDEPLIDGTYTGWALCADLDSPTAYSPYYLAVVIEVVNGRVVGISDIYADADGIHDSHYHYDEKENLSYLHRAINGYGLRTRGMKAKLEERIAVGRTTDDIDTVSGATWSSRSILEAYEDALSQARQPARRVPVGAKS